MKQKKALVALIFLFLFAVLFYIVGVYNFKSPIEQPVVQIPLLGPVADPSAELSGLAWYGDNLILLPQYPNVFDETGDGFLYYLPKDEIIAWLDGKSQTALEPRPIQLIAPGLEDQIRNYQGFESIGFSGRLVFMTIEAGEGTDMQGYLISGTISPDLGTLYLDTSHLALIPTQSHTENHADEAMLIRDDKVITFHEVDGELVNPNPVAHVFDIKLNFLETIPMTNIEYRLTDTAWGSENTFWGINYFYPGDEELIPISDPIVDRYGESESNVNFEHVERLVKFSYSDNEIKLASAPPISLQLTEAARNWEGLVVLDSRGFLMATDKFPETILGFVPMPE